MSGRYRMATMRPPLEKVEQHGICALTAQLGGKPYILGTRRRRGDYPGTNQTPGLADLWLVLPPFERVVRVDGGRRVDPMPGLGLWWETKRRGEDRTDAQLDFAAWCALTATPYGFGTLDDFIAWLIARGRLRHDQVHYARLPAHLQESP